jgi:spore maturation protein SpmB
VVGLFWVGFLVLLGRHVWIESSRQAWPDLIRGVMSFWVLAALVGGLVLFGWSRGVKVYESLVEGAKEGFQVALRIIPYLVAILVAVGMLRSSGGIDLLVRVLGPLTASIGMPAEALPMALLRPLSGSGAYGVMAEIMTEHGADSFIGYMVSTFQGSTETTFYVLAVYFGAVGVKETRHTLPACLLADTAGILAAVFIVNVFF